MSISSLREEKHMSTWIKLIKYEHMVNTDDMTGYASYMWYVMMSHPLGWLSRRAADFLHDSD